ncbi:MAG: hypothetical protein HS116_16800 [Planctomycetes bacterium]|nr:hypothetical protein [Planctomycetota bacterium]
MKFFFCEKCGKRLTDREIEMGKAKDKKIRGVYCTDCAEGVMTLETLPLTDEQAMELTQQASPAQPQAERLKPAAPAAARRAAAAQARPRTVQASKQPPYVLIIGGVVAIGCIVVMVVLSSGSGPQPEKKVATGQSATVAAPRLVTEPPLPDLEPPAPMHAPKPEPIAVKVEAPRPKPEPPTVAAPVTPEPVHKAPEPPVVQATPKTPVEPSMEPRLYYEEFYGEFMGRLAVRDAASALKRLERARQDPRLEGFTEALKLDEALAQSAAELERALGAGAEQVALRKPDFKLVKAGGQALETGAEKPARITSFKDNEFTIEIALGKGASAQQKWKLDELGSETRGELMRMGLAQVADSGIKLVFAQAPAWYGSSATADASGIKALVEQAGAAQAGGSSPTLCAHVRERLEARMRELAAEAELQALAAKADAKEWETVPGLIERARTLHAGTLALYRAQPRFAGWLAAAADWGFKRPGPVTDAWIAAVASLRPEDQVEAVNAKLKELNPKLPDTKIRSQVGNSAIVGLKIDGQNLSDITPLRALKSLQRLETGVIMGHEGKLDLAPLAHLPELLELHAYNSRVFDLAPLRSCKIAVLNIAACPRIKDYSPLGEMPGLKNLTFDPKPSPEIGAILRKIKTLTTVNGKPAAQFLEQCK